MAAKHCKANVGTRSEPRECGGPVAKGMLAACEQHKTTMIPTGTPGVFYRGGQYVAVSRSRGKQHKSFHRTFGEAREAKADRSGSGRPAPQTKRPFDEYARAWIASYQGRTRRGFDADTRAHYERALEQRAIPHFGRTPLRDVDRESIEKLISTMQRDGLSAASIAAYLAPVRALFADAVERGHVTASPATKLRINAKAAPKAPVEHEKALSRAELSAILRAIPERHRLIFEVMAGTGCRISEALGLEWRDLGSDGDHPTLRIERQSYRGTLKPNAKTDAGERTIELPPALARALWERGADATGPMFHTRSGARLSDRNLRRVLDAVTKPQKLKSGELGPAVAGPGLEWVSFHTFRHTHGSMLLDEGWTIPEVSKRLGHASPKITAEVYSHAMRDRSRPLDFLDAVGNGLGNAWATQRPETAATRAPTGIDEIVSEQAE